MAGVFKGRKAVTPAGEGNPPESTHLRKRLADLSILYEISSIPTSGIPMDELFDSVLDKATKLMKAEKGVVFLFDEFTEKLEVRAHRGFGNEGLKIVSLGPGEGLPGRAFKEGRTILFDDKDEIHGGEPLGIPCPAKQALAMPIKAGLETVCVLCLGRDSSRKFAPADLERLTVLADRMGAAVENAELLKKQKKIIRQLRALNEMGKAVVGTFETNSLFEQSVTLIEDIAPYPFVFGLIVDRENRELVQVAKAGRLKDTVPLKYRQRMDQGMIGRTAVTGDMQISGDVHTHPDYLDFFPEIKSEMAVPIKTRDGEVMGVLDVQSEKPNAFQQDDIATVQTIAEQISVALENSRLYKDLQKKVNELSTLYLTGQVIAGTLDLESVLDSILANLGRMIPLYAAGILLFDRSSGELRIKAFTGPEMPGIDLKNMRIKPGRGVTGAVFLSKKGLIVPDVRKEPRYIQGHPEIKSEMAVPLIFKDEIMGVLNAESDEVNVYNEDHLRIMNYFANQAGIAIRNAQLFEETRLLAATDFLTGVWNRRYIEKRLRAELANARRFREEISILVIDLDNFKLFNDTYGHSEGDRILSRTAQVLLGICREIDVVGRYGGDEFIILLPKTGAQGASVVGERILSAVRSEDFETPDGSRTPLSLSIGAATYPSDADEVDRLLSMADAAMFRGKVAGGNTFVSLSARSHEKLEDAPPCFDVLQGLVSAVDTNDHYTLRHSREVTKLSLVLGRKIGLSREDMKTLEAAGILHDVGKIELPADLLNKPGALTPEEWKVIQEHPRMGYMILQQIQRLGLALQVVLHHHERYDGKGYPSGLKAENIPRLARILAIADAFSAMRTDRPYRKALTLEAAVEEIRRNTGKQFDPVLAGIFVDLAVNGELDPS